MMKLPAWMLLGIAILAGILIWFGWEDHHETGYLPFIFGILFALFVLGVTAMRLKPEPD
jgi:hypothetical protein